MEVLVTNIASNERCNTINLPKTSNTDIFYINDHN